MLSKIVSLFTPAPTPEKQTQESHDERLRLATCVLLLEVAGADNEFSPEECEHIIDILKRRFHLSQDDAEELIQTAEARRAESYDLFKFTNAINTTCTNDEKQEILQEIWRVIFTDGTLDGHEDYVIHKLARLLNLTHPQLIKAKQSARKPV